jgi:hypothetical protein
MMCRVAVMILLIAFCSAGSGPIAGERAPDAIAPVTPIQIDPVLFRFLTSPDAMLIKILHVRSERKLLANLGITPDQNGLAFGQFQKKKLVFHRTYELRGEHRHVFVYDPCLHMWPGTQPETIVICDASYRPLNWKEVGGSPMFENATLDVTTGTAPVLLLTRRHRHTIPDPKRGIYGFSIGDDKIEPLPEVKWLYEDDAERAQYDQWRKAIRERQKNNRLN